MTVGQDRVFEAVQGAVAAAMGLAKEEIAPDARLFADLGAESIDVLDIFFRINKSLGTDLAAADLDTYIQGGIPDDEFADGDNIITAKGLQQLKSVMPQVDSDELRGTLRAEEVANMLTVQNLAGMISRSTGVVAG
jgi:acyl carrier protein